MEDYKEIKSVSLNTPNKKDPMSAGAVEVFNVTHKDGQVLQVPADPSNRHYWMVREWYNRHKKPGFEFDFADIAEPKPEPESDEDGSGLTIAAVQTENANLPDVNLTKAQRKEIADQNK